MKDLTQSAIDRQNILNNSQAVEKIQNFIGLTGLFYEGEYLFTSKMVADFFKVDIRTIKRAIENFEKEIKHNGYQVLDQLFWLASEGQLHPLVAPEQIGSYLKGGSVHIAKK